MFLSEIINYSALNSSHQLFSSLNLIFGNLLLRFLLTDRMNTVMNAFVLQHNIHHFVLWLCFFKHFLSLFFLFLSYLLSLLQQSSFSIFLVLNLCFFFFNLFFFYGNFCWRFLFLFFRLIYFCSSS